MDTDGALQTEQKDLTTLKSKRMRKKWECMVKASYKQQMWNIKTADQTSKDLKESNNQNTTCLEIHGIFLQLKLHISAYTGHLRFLQNCGIIYKSCNDCGGC